MNKKRKRKKRLPHFKILFEGDIIWFEPLNDLADKYVEKGGKQYYFINK